MGFLDKVKENASKVASDAGRATKVAQAQMKVKSLQGDVEGVKKEIGGIAYDLIVAGELTNAAFDEKMARISRDPGAGRRERGRDRGAQGETAAAATAGTDETA